MGSRNSSGRLIRKRAEAHIGNTTLPAGITLHEGNFGGNGIVVLTIHKSFSVNSELKFVVVERPAIGSVRILDRAGEEAELLLLAADRDAASAWLEQHKYPGAVLDEVAADEISAADVEGRAAA